MLIFIVLVILAAAYLQFGFVLPFEQVMQNRCGTDYHAYYFTAAGCRDGCSIYDHWRMIARSRKATGVKNIAPLVYPPFFVFSYLPMLLFSFRTSRFIWLVMSQVCLAGSAAAAWMLLKDRLGRAPPWWWVAVFILGTGSIYYPVIDHQWQAQSNLQVLCITSWALYFAHRKKPAELPAGILLAWGIGMKLMPGIFLLWFAVRRRWRMLALMALSGVVLIVLSMTVINHEDYIRFPQILSGSMYATGGPSMGNYSMVSAAGIVFTGLKTWPRVYGALVKFAQYIPLAIFIFMVWREKRNRAAPEIMLLRLSQGFILMGFVMAKWWEHHLVFLLFPYFILGAVLRSYPRSSGLIRFLTASGFLVVALPVMGNIQPFGSVNLVHFIQWFSKAIHFNIHLYPFMAFKFTGILLLLVAQELFIRMVARAGYVNPRA